LEVPKLDEKEIHELLTDEVAYRVYVLSTFKDVENRLRYQEGLLENTNVDLNSISSNLENLLIEHKTCTDRVSKSLIYEETWRWTHKIKKLWDSVLPKVLGSIIIGLLLWLLYLYVTHLPVQQRNHVPVPTLPSTNGGHQQ
jgi:hypothetical protein